MIGRGAMGWVVVACTATLAACGSMSPKADGPDPARKVESHTGQTGKSASRRSPYAPAQEDPGKRGNYIAGGLYAPGISDRAPVGGIPDIDLIPEPVVQDETRSSYGNRSPYVVLGKSYRVLDGAKGYDETGLASYYGNKFHGRRTSNLEVYDMYAFTAAHKTLPLPSYARVTNLSNGKSVVVRVNDRGPFHDGRIIDLSYAAAVKLGVDRAGTAQVEVKGLSAGENAREPYDAVADAATVQPTGQQATGLPPGVHIATGQPTPMPPSAIDQLIDVLPIGAAAASGRDAGQLASQAAAETTAGTLATGLAVTTARKDPGWRFNMSRDGRTMSADEFDAWMRSRQVSVATGKPVVRAVNVNEDSQSKVPDAHQPSAPQVSVAPQTTPMTATAAPTPVASQSSGNIRAGGADAGVTLQIASFAARANAEHALAMLTGAGISGARLQDADANGLHVWRLRVGPVAMATETELVARIRGLGFGLPQRVRE